MEQDLRIDLCSVQSDLGSVRREDLSKVDYKENNRPVIHSVIESERLVNQKGTAEYASAAENSEKLSGWNSKHKSPHYVPPLTLRIAAYRELENDGTFLEKLDDSAKGQTHRAGLNEDKSLRNYEPEEDFLPNRHRGAAATRGGLQSGRGGSRMGKHGRTRYVLSYQQVGYFVQADPLVQLLGEMYENEYGSKLMNYTLETALTIQGCRQTLTRALRLSQTRMHQLHGGKSLR